MITRLLQGDQWIGRRTSALIYGFFRGGAIARSGLAGDNSIEWKSKYGSVVVTGYDIGTADGMNEKGLVANLLYLAESDYGDTQGKPTLSMSLWAQYVLDNYATVAEAVEELKNELFRTSPLFI